MAATYYLLLTEYGQAKIAALLAGETIDLSDGFVAIGDANGQPYLPESRLDETDLVNERARVPIQSVVNVAAVTTVLATIDSTIGGFNLHELAILDETEQAVYLGNYHGQYKPVLTEGAGGEIELNLQLGTAGIGPVFLQVDPTVVTANKAWVNANFVRITTFDAHVIAEASAREDGDTASQNYAHNEDLALAEAFQEQIDNLQAQMNSFLDDQGNGDYGVGTHTVKVYPGLSKTFTLWGAGASGGGSRSDGNYPGTTDGNDGGNTSITYLGVVASGGDKGIGGSWANGSSYTDGTGGTGGVASGASTTNTSGNNGTASVADRSGGAAVSHGHGTGGDGAAGLGDLGLSFGGGGGSGAKAIHTYTNSTSSVVELTLIVGAAGVVGAYGGAAGVDGYATVSS